jgi:hypothetical protein
MQEAKRNSENQRLLPIAYCQLQKRPPQGGLFIYALCFAVDFLFAFFNADSIAALRLA